MNSQILQAIKRFGKSFTVTTTSSSSYSLVTGGKTNTTSQRTVLGYVYNSKVRFGKESLTATGKKAILLLPYDTSNVAIPKPVVGTVVEDSTITEVQEVVNKGSVLLYICSLDK